MKQKKWKKAVAMLSALAMGMMLIAGVPTIAKADNGVTDAMVQEIVLHNETCREMLNDEVWGPECDGPAYRFGVVDVDGDGLEELVVKAVNPDEKEWKSADDFVAWKDGEIVWSWSSYILSSLYYCPETGCVMIMQNFEPNSNVPMNGVGNIYIFGYDEAGKMEELLYVCIMNGVYMSNDTNEECTESEIAEIEAKMNAYMPEKVLLEAPYEVTEENLDTYLSVDAAVVRESLERELVKEVTTEAITLKVGEAFGLSMENIDKLLADAGYDYESNPSSVPKIFYGDRVKMDTEFLMPASGVGVFDVDTFETLDMLYVADEEWPALMEDVDNGTLAGKYGKEVGLVEEAEGFAYYARAEKSGETTVIIPEYPTATGETLSITIPVMIEAVSQDDKEEDTEEDKNETSDEIASTTDDTIVIDNTNSVLPAGTVLESVKLESGTVYENAEKILKEEVAGLGKYSVYELNLTDGDSNEIHQLNGKVSVTMNLPFVMSDNTVLKVYRVDNEALVNCPATVSNGKVIFETDHFSTYILAEEPAPIAVPPTGDTSFVVAFMLLMFVGVAMCGTVLFGKKYE